MRGSKWLAVMVAAGLIGLLPARAGAIGGLHASYFLYDGAYLEDFSFNDPGYTHVFDRIDPAITFGWLEEHYAENNGNGVGFDWEPLGSGAGAFGVRWDGLLTIPGGFSVYLGTESDDGSYVFIDDALFVDNGTQHWPWYRWSDSQLAAGTYRITTYAFENDLTPPWNKSGIDLWWSTERGVGITSGWVPGDWLTPQAEAVPEPTTLLLLLTGAGTAALARRRRRLS